MTGLGSFATVRFRVENAEIGHSVLEVNSAEKGESHFEGEIEGAR